MIAERIEKRRRKKDELQGQLAIEMGKQVTFITPQIKPFLHSLKRGNVNDENNRRGRMPPGCPPPKRGPSRAEAGMKNLPRCGGERLNSKLPCAMKPLRSNIPLISHHVSQAPIVFTLCPCAWQPIGGNLAAGLLRNYPSKKRA